MNRFLLDLAALSLGGGAVVLLLLLAARLTRGRYAAGGAVLPGCSSPCGWLSPSPCSPIWGRPRHQSS